MCVKFGEPDCAPSKAHCPCLKTAASTSSAGNPEPTDTIPAPDVSAPVPTPAGCFASAKLFAKQKGQVSPAKENINVRFRNRSEKKEDSTEKLKKETDEVCKRHACYLCESLYWLASSFQESYIITGKFVCLQIKTVHLCSSSQAYRC